MEMMSSKNVWAVIFSLGISIVLVLSFWGFSHWSNHAETVDTLDKHIIQWNNLALKNYKFVATEACMLVGTNEIKVEDGKPVLVHGKKMVTIDGVFKRAKEAILTAHRLTIEYHPLYGFPQTIEVDWNGQVTDDECSYSITGFTPF